MISVVVRNCSSAFFSLRILKESHSCPISWLAIAVHWILVYNSLSTE